MKKVFFLLVTATLFYSCDNNYNTKTSLESSENLETVNLKLEKKREFYLSSDSSKLGRVESPMLYYETPETAEKKLVFYDLGLNQVIISDSIGNIETTIGRKGNGPKEFRHITSFGLSKDTIIVYDGSLDLVKKFNFDGDLLVSYPGLLKDKIWIRSNRLYEHNGKLLFGIQESGKSSSSTHWLSKTVAVYNSSGELIELIGEFDPDLVQSHQLYNYANITYSKDGFVYTTHRTSPTIQKINLETGEIVSRFGNLSDNFRLSKERPRVEDPREVKNKINTKFSFVGDSFVSEKYFAFYFFNFTEEFFELRNPNDNENFLQIYDLEDNYIGDVSLPYYPLGMDEQSQLYLLEDDNPDRAKIGVYEVIQ